MTHKGLTTEGGLRVSAHVCETCGEEFTLCPPVEKGVAGWEGCGSEGCASYDPSRDMDIVFMTDAEIARDKPLVSMKMLKKRRAFQETGAL